MHHYRLVPAPTDGCDAQEIAFMSEDASRAFDLARMQEYPTELWIDGKHFCTISRGAEDGFWVLTSSPNDAVADGEEESSTRGMPIPDPV